MSDMNESGLRILAVYVRKADPKTPDPGAVTYHDQSLRVDGQGLIPRASPTHKVLISLDGDPMEYRFPVPPEFNKQKCFVIKAAELPVEIPYEKSAMVSIVEEYRGRDRILAKTPLRYRTL